jgi:pimeloyl-ACP methyl ester carboxylesterase
MSEGVVRWDDGWTWYRIEGDLGGAGAALVISTEDLARHMTTWSRWRISRRLGAVNVPTLVISGEYDEATPAVVRPLVQALPDARWELIDDARHTPHLEQPERFLELIESFLAAHD